MPTFSHLSFPNPKGVASQSPGLRRQSLPGVSPKTNSTNLPLWFGAAGTRRTRGGRLVLFHAVVPRAAASRPGLAGCRSFRAREQIRCGCRGSDFCIRFCRPFCQADRVKAWRTFLFLLLLVWSATGFSARPFNALSSMILLKSGIVSFEGESARPVVLLLLFAPGNAVPVLTEWPR